MDVSPKNEQLDFTVSEMVTIKHEEEDYYEAMVITGQGNEKDNFTENYEIPIQEESLESELDPLSTNTEYSNIEDNMMPIKEESLESELDPLSTNNEYSNSEDDMELRNIYVKNVWNLNLKELEIHPSSLRNIRIKKFPISNSIMREYGVEEVLIKSEPEEEAKHISDIIVSDHSEDCGDNRPQKDPQTVEEVLIENEPQKESNPNIEIIVSHHNEDNGRSQQDPRIMKLFIMWKGLYPEVDEQEQRNIYQETEGNVPQSMERMRILNADRKMKKFISQKMGQQDDIQHHNLDQDKLPSSVNPQHIGSTSPIAKHLFGSFSPVPSTSILSLLPKHHSGPLPPMQLPHDDFPTPKGIDEGTWVIPKRVYSCSVTSMTVAERKRKSRAKSTRASKRERERNHIHFPCVQCGEKFIRKTNMLKHFQKHQISSQASGNNKESHTVLNGTWWSTTEASKKNYKRHLSKQPVPVPEGKLQNSKVKFISQQLGEHDDIHHQSLDQNEPPPSVYPHQLGLTSPTPKGLDEGTPVIIPERIYSCSLASASEKKKPMTLSERKRRSRANQSTEAREQERERNRKNYKRHLSKLPVPSEGTHFSLLPKHQSGPMAEMRLQHEHFPTPKGIDECTPWIIPEIVYSCSLTSASKRKKPMTLAERKRRSRANQSTEARERELERNRKNDKRHLSKQRVPPEGTLFSHLPKHQSSPMPPMQLLQEYIPTPKDIDEDTPEIIPERAYSCSLTSAPEIEKKKPMTLAETNQSTKARECEKNRKAFPCVQCGEKFYHKTIMLKHFQKHQISSNSASQSCSQASDLNKESHTVLNNTWWSTTEAAKKNYKRHLSKQPEPPERKRQNSKIITKEIAEDTLSKREPGEDSNPNIGVNGMNNNEDDYDTSPPPEEAKTNKYLKMWKVLYIEVDVQEQMDIYQDNNCNVRQTMDKIRHLNEQRLRKKYPVIQAKISATKQKQKQKGKTKCQQTQKANKKKG